MDRLKSENEALLKCLKDLEDTGVKLGGEDLAPQQKEKRLLRLRQISTSKSAQFKNAIASILGTKLAFYPNSQVRVKSMDDLNASFVLQPTPATGGMKMQLVAKG